MPTEKTFILDCSITMAWCFEDEKTAYTENILDSLSSYSVMVPTLWSIEVANVLLMAQRKKRINHFQVAEFIDMLSVLPIEIDPLTPGHGQYSTLEIAEETGLTLYDATYLELAFRLQAPMATLDKALQQAAKKLDIVQFQPPHQ